MITLIVEAVSINEGADHHKNVFWACSVSLCIHILLFITIKSDIKTAQ